MNIVLCYYSFLQIEISDESIFPFFRNEYSNVIILFTISMFNTALCNNIILYILNNVFDAAKNLTRNTCLIALIKNIHIKQNIRENILHCWFYKTSIKVLRLISKTPSNTFANSAANFHWLFLKTNSVIYYCISYFLTNS